MTHSRTMYTNSHKYTQTYTKRTPKRTKTLREQISANTLVHSVADYDDCSQRCTLLEPYLFMAYFKIRANSDSR